MADKSITDLSEATELVDNGLLVVYQSGETKKMQGRALKQYIETSSHIEDAERAADRAEAAAAEATQVVTHTPYIGENGNWFVWDNFKKKYVDSTVDASITVQIADVTMLPFGSNPYITNTGTDTDPVFHLFIPSAKNGNDGYTPVKGVDYFDGKTPVKGIDYNDGTDGFSPTVSVSQISGGHKVTVTDKSGSKNFDVMDGDSITGIVRISGTGEAGTVDTYAVTTSSGGSYTFNVRNGADGKGTGDMLKSVYDPTGRAQDIFAYADTKSGKAVSFTVTLTAAGWIGNAQTVSNSNLAANGYAYTVSPKGDSFAGYADAVIYADNVTQDGKMTFHCNEAPTVNLTVNILRTEVTA